MRGLFFAILLWSLLPVSIGYALPKHALKEKKRCYECHYNRKGGGPLNQRGAYYSRNRTLEGYGRAVTKLAKRPAEPPPKAIIVTEPAAPEEITVTAPPPPSPSFRGAEMLWDKTSLSANILLSFIGSENKKGPNDFHLMRAEPLVTTQVTRNFLTVFGYNFAMPLLTAYGQYQKGDTYVQLGSFYVPFGLDTLDHNNLVSTLLKEHYDLTLDTRDVGIEIGFEKDWFLRGAVFNGGREPRERPTLLPTFDRNLGFVVNGGFKGIAFEIPFLLGASALYERRVPPGAVMRGRPPKPAGTDRKTTSILNLYGQLNYHDFSLLGEFGYGRNTPFDGDDSFGFYLRPALNLTDKWDVAFRYGLFAQDRKFLRDSFMRYVVSTEYHFSKYASVEPMIRINQESGTVTEVDDNEFIILANMKF